MATQQKNSVLFREKKPNFLLRAATLYTQETHERFRARDKRRRREAAAGKSRQFSRDWVLPTHKCQIASFLSPANASVVAVSLEMDPLSLPEK